MGGCSSAVSPEDPNAQQAGKTTWCACCGSRWVVWRSFLAARINMTRKKCCPFCNSNPRKFCASECLTIIGRGWAKYRDLSVASRSIICRSRRLRQIIDLRDTDKSRYFSITEFNNCFIIRSSRLFSYFNHFLAAHGSDLPFFSRERGSNYAWAEYYLQQNTFRRYYAWADDYL